jgi:GNAT superfamily N-acetyltransferase
MKFRPGLPTDADSLSALAKRHLTGIRQMRRSGVIANVGLAHLWYLYVRPRWWGSGVAARLLSAAVVEAHARGYEVMNLWAPRANPRALAFYEREGWRATGAERRSRSDASVELVEYRLALPG